MIYVHIDKLSKKKSKEMIRKLNVPDGEELVISRETIINLGTLSINDFQRLLGELNELYFLMHTPGGKEVIGSIKK